MPDDFIFRDSIDNYDPDLDKLVAEEDRRQKEKIILVASESIAPPAVRKLMSTNFGNVYAEGYPRHESRKLTETEILDLDAELAHYRRYSDPRYYKGVEYADILEALARRRAAELFATNGIAADDLYINVQPLSGSPANMAVYSALLQPGDKIMALDLIHGGHLTHGSKVSRSGKAYEIVPYRVDLETERLDYDVIETLAMETRPQIIVAGYTAYPLQVDWSRFRAIADKSGAYLMADMAHISGLVAAGVHPSPIGIADVVTTTTHKSLCGPRGAMIMTHRLDISRKIDRAVFPGEQGGPHLNTIAALALALKLANTDKFRRLQQRVVHNAARLGQRLSEGGLRIVAGSSENHLLLLDTKSIIRDGVPLSGDMAARILDVAGIVTNRNTIPGDKSAFSATGIRLGTVWISQLGYGDAEVDMLAEAMVTLLKGCEPFTYLGRGRRRLLRAKVDPQALSSARMVVNKLTRAGLSDLLPPDDGAGADTVKVRGPEASEFLNYALTSDVIALEDGQSQPSHLVGANLDEAITLHRLASDHYLMRFATTQRAQVAVQWLQDLSDGYIKFDDLYCKLPGPIVVSTIESDSSLAPPDDTDQAVAPNKPYFVGHDNYSAGIESLEEFSWQEPDDGPLLKTALHETHMELGGRMVSFGGWDMPVWYSSVSAEHAAVRQTAGLFDVSHMGVLEASGPFAAEFLETVTTNDLSTLKIGHSHYTYLLFPDGSVVDDLLIYRRGSEKYMLVVNASNNDKDWAWLNAVNDGQVQIDSRRPWAKIQHPAILRDLRDLKWGEDCLVDIALQGPRSTDILLSMCKDETLAAKIKALPWAGLTEGNIQGHEVIISRTGYTGERNAFELFVHPDRTPEIWQALLTAGEPFGLTPCGLAARDSTRTEAGLPLYGHELAGPLGLNPADAGFGSYVKLWKPFFVGRAAFINHEKERQNIVVRFRMNEKGVRRSELGDPVLDKRGKVVGSVTSCAIDSEGYLLGQALVPLSLAKVDGEIFIYQLGGGQRPLRVPATIKTGARLPIPDGATIVSRFPKAKKN